MLSIMSQLSLILIHSIYLKYSINNAAIINPPDNYNAFSVDCIESYACSQIKCPTNATCDISCNGDYTCMGLKTQCPTNGNCNILCNGTNACYNAVIKWPINGDANITCIDSGCFWVHFPFPPSNEDFELICDAKSSNCYGASIYCPLDANCCITCNGDNACYRTTIKWPKNGNGTLICSGNDACKQATRPPIYATDDHQNFYLDCSADSQCYGAVIHCPKEAECHISCTGTRSCYEATFIWPEDYFYSLTCADAFDACYGIEYTPYNHSKPLLIAGSLGVIIRFATIDCPTNADCNISCEGSCQSMTVNCHLEHPCNIECGGGCFGATINGYGRVSGCNGHWDCLGMTFPIPPPNEEFVLNCNDDGACHKSVIYCPMNAECHISCNGNEACAEARIMWSTNTIINSTLTCNESYPNACSYVNTPYFDVINDDNNSDFYMNCGDYECQGAIIHCPTNAGCYITCNGVLSCNAAIFKLIDDKPYNITCTGSGSCIGTNITQYDDNIDMTMECNLFKMCKDATIKCPKNASCTIICSGSYACENAVLHGPINHSFTVRCNSYSCMSLSIYAQNSSIFNLNGCEIVNSCNGISIRFPPNDNGRKATIIIYDTAFAVFYAQNGWNDVTITSPTQYIDHRGIMHCDNDYSISCDFVWNEWACDPYGVYSCNDDNDTNIPQPTMVIYVTGTNTTQISQYPANSTNIASFQSNTPTIAAITSTHSTKAIQSNTTNPSVVLNTNNTSIADTTIWIVISISCVLCLVLTIIAVIIHKHKSKRNQKRSDYEEIEIEKAKPKSKTNIERKASNEETINLVKNDVDHKDQAISKRLEDSKSNENVIEGGEGNNNDEYEWIKSTLKTCDDQEWEKYFSNFKKHKMTDKRVEYIVNDDNNVMWQQLIPEIGVWLEFKTKWKNKRKANTQYI